jgi:glycosyltransferase involved in cell wall biosynthesis
MGGWLINDCLTCIPGTITLWHNLLEWFPDLLDKTNGYTDYSILASIIENELELLSYKEKPKYIIRNGSYFRKINTDIKQISLVQDIHDNKAQQIDVINYSSVVVFNTNYVYKKYKNYINDNILVKICPLGVDFDFFTPFHNSEEMTLDVLPNSILFIGSSANYPKGFNVLLDIIKKMENQNFCLIMKDDFTINNIDLTYKHRVKIYNRIDREKVRTIINSCILSICTSYEETQHLSGIECAACNIPIVARQVGIYDDNKDDPLWGMIADDTNFVEVINTALQNIHKFKPRECFIHKYSLDICRNNWIKIIQNLQI